MANPIPAKAMAAEDHESNPYFLHSSNHPRLVLVSQTLISDNYASQQRSMEMVLNTKNKLPFVTGSLPKPNVVIDPQAAAKWQHINDVVSS